MEGSIVDTRDGRRRPFRWQVGTVVFGSGVEADLVLPDASVQPKHGRFEVSESGCRLIVEASAPAVKVNGSPTKESAIAAGDVVKIGPFQLSLASTRTTAPVPAAKAPVAAAAAPPAPIDKPRPASRPAAAASAEHHASHRYSTSTARSARAPASTGDPEVDEARASARYRARTAGKSADAKSWLIGGGILGGIVLLAAIFMFSGAKAWDLNDESFPQERLAINQMVGTCQFDAALARIKDLMDRAKESSTVNKLVDLRRTVERSKTEFDNGKKELERIRNTAGKRQTYYIVNDDLPKFQHDYNQFKPLVEEAQLLSDELRKGKMSVPANQASEADLAPGTPSPAFEKRGDHSKKDGGN